MFTLNHVRSITASCPIPIQHPHPVFLFIIIIFILMMSYSILDGGQARIDTFIVRIDNDSINNSRM